MAEGLKDRLDQVLGRLSVLEKKLDKLEAIEAEIQEENTKVSKLESKVNNLQGEITQLRGKHDEIDKCARKLESDVAFMNGTVEKMEAELNGLKALHNLDINSLNQKLLYSEAYSRRENLKFINIPEARNEEGEGGEGREDTREILWKFLEENLHIEFQRVHRNGRKINNKPRPILARFLRFTDREKVRKNAKELIL